MQREFLKKIEGLTDEVINSIMAENGKDIEAVKAKFEKAENDLKESKSNLDTLTSELQALKDSNATAEEYKAKFEQLQNDIKAKAEQSEQEKIAREKADGVTNRFNSILGDKKFSHDAIKNDYLKKFGEALESKDFEGKSDTDIFHDLTKDDAAAFVGVTAINLTGGNTGIGGETKTEFKSFF